MLLEILLALMSTAPVAAQPAPATPVPVSEQTEEEFVALLVDRLTEVCARHPEVERAFVVAQPDEKGQTTYMFIPIFDREVSDEALAEADAEYRKLAPNRGSLPLMLLTRNSWKKMLGGATPIYVRPGK